MVPETTEVDGVPDEAGALDPCQDVDVFRSSFCEAGGDVAYIAIVAWWRACFTVPQRFSPQRLSVNTKMISDSVLR